MHESEKKDIIVLSFCENYSVSPLGEIKGIATILQFIIIFANPLPKHAYSNILKISPLKAERFQIKILIFFHISAQNIDRGYSLEPPCRGGSNKYPQSMFLAEIRKIMYTPVNPSFTIQKWGLRGPKLYRYIFVMIIIEVGPSEVGPSSHMQTDRETDKDIILSF